MGKAGIWPAPQLNAPRTGTATGRHAAACDRPPRTPEGRELYKRRGATAEPGIGNLKKILDRFSRRGLDNATAELQLAATAFNLRKIHIATLA